MTAGMDIAFGVLGAVALAIELVDSISKLLEFMDSLVDAPEGIRSLCSDLRIMSCILKDTKNADIQGSDTVIVEAVRECAKHVRALSDFTNSLISGFESKKSLRRSWASIKTTKKTKRLEYLRTRLNSAKITLVIAQQVWLR